MTGLAPGSGVNVTTSRPVCNVGGVESMAASAPQTSFAPRPASATGRGPVRSPGAGRGTSQPATVAAHGGRSCTRLALTNGRWDGSAEGASRMPSRVRRSYTC